MNAQDIAVLLAALGAFATVFGTGAKWVMVQINSYGREAADREEKARGLLSARLEQEISFLRMELAKVQVERQTEKSLFLKRIYQLEHFILVKDLSLPLMDGWPPT